MQASGSCKIQPEHHKLQILMSPNRHKIKNLILHVEQIKEKEFSHEFEENPQVFPIIAEMVNNRQCEFLKPFKARNKTEFRLEAAGDGTEVTWTMIGRKTLLARIMGIFKSMDSMLGPDFEKGLARLKAVAEQQAE